MKPFQEHFHGTIYLKCIQTSLLSDSEKFQFVDETLCCDHPIETAPAVLLRGNKELVCSSNFLVCVNEALWHDHLN